MRHITTLGCLSALMLLAACGSPNYGYYDSNGNWIPPSNSSTEAKRRHSPSPGVRYDDNAPYYEQGAYVDGGAPRVTATTTTYTYDRAGYYDYNGYYIGERSAFNMPRTMFPPRGMCRVWFPDRAARSQPAIESCTDINYRVPAGAYVIYGG